MSFSLFFGRFSSTISRKSALRRHRLPLHLELLENRTVPAVFNVNTIADTQAVNLSTGADASGNISLRSALEAANATGGGNTVNLTVGGDYRLSLVGANAPGSGDNTKGGALVILPSSGGVTINNTSGAFADVDGAGLDRVFDINPQNTSIAATKIVVSMSGFTIENGLAQPGDGAPGTGGGIRNQGNTNLTLNNMVVTGNNASADGGGISMENLVSTPWTLTVNNSIISLNRAGDAGGGIETDGTGKVNITGSQITANTTVNQGAGVWLDAVATGTVTNPVITNGGSGYTSAPTVTFSPPIPFGGTTATGIATISGGVVTSIIITNPGSGYSLIAPTITITGGGGIGATATSTGVTANQSATLKITTSTINKNVAITGPGGGVGQAGSSTVTITSSTLSNNFAGMTGGGFGDQNGLGTLILVNDTIVHNTAVADGGGVATDGPATLIDDTTVTDNAAQADGGGLQVGSASFTINNTIVASNFAGPMNLVTGMVTAINVTNGGSGYTTVPTVTLTNAPGDTTGSGATATAVLTGTTVSSITVNTAGTNYTLPPAVTITGGGGNGATATSQLIGAGPDIDAIVTAAPASAGNFIGIGDTFLTGITNGANGNQIGSATAPLIALLSPLQANGGPTATEVPLVGSLVIDKGVNSAVPATDPITGAALTDQRGLSRIFNVTVDVGADEFQGSTTTTPMGASSTAFNVNTLADTQAVNLVTGQDASGNISLRSALEAANAKGGGSTINLTLGGDYQITTPGANTGTNLSGAFVILPSSGGVTINNTSGAFVDVDGAGLDRVFDINPQNTSIAATKIVVAMSGFTIENGFAQPGDGAPGSGGGIRDQGNTNLTLTNMVVTSNNATADGGGISMENLVSTPWTLTINSSTINLNRAGDAGGGVETDGTGKVNITASDISANTTVNQGAGVWLDAVAAGTVTNPVITNGGSGYTSAPTVTFTPPVLGTTATGIATISGGVVTSIIITNPGSGYPSAPPTITITGGGGTGATATSTTVTADQSATLKITTSLISANKAVNGPGGGVGQAGSSTITITSSTLSDNYSGTTGGGFADQNDLGTLDLLNDTVVDNTAVGTGGGVSTDGPTTLIEDTTVTGNASQTNDGGLESGSIALTMNNTIVAGNFAGPMNFVTGTVTAINVTNGGSGYTTVPTVTLTNAPGDTTGSGATATAVLTGTTVTAINVTVAGTNYTLPPVVTITGGGGSGATATSQLTANSDLFAIVSAAPASSGNFIGIGTSQLTGITNGTNGNQIGSATAPLIALLTPLQNNGGPTVTEAPLAGSLVIDKGITAAVPATDPITGLALTDQRGFPRIVGAAVDVGADESQGSVSINPTTVPIGTVGNAYSSTTFTGAGGTGFGYTLTETGTLPAGLTFNAGTITGTPTAAGSDTIVIHAVDSAGDIGSASYALTVNPAIVVAPATVPTGTVGSAYPSPTFTATGGSNSSFTFAETGTLPTGITFNAATDKLTGTPTQSGTFPITITATDTIGATGSTSYSLAINPLTTAPAITSSASTTFAVGAAGSFTVTATGMPTPTLSESGALPTGVVFVPALTGGTGSLMGTPAAGTAGTYPITFTASNGVNPNATQNFTLIVTATGVSPAITSAPSITFGIGTSDSFTVTATGAPTPTLSESGALPTGVTFVAATGLLSGTPAAGTAGAFPLIFTATNSVGVTTQNFTLTVANAAAPTITSSGSTTFTVGTVGTFTVLTTGAPTATVTESGTLPTGVTFNSATDVLSGTPAAGTVGSYPLVFTASNGITPNATQNFTLTVNPAAVAPTITSLESTTFLTTVSGSFSVTFTGTPPTTVTESGTLPTGITFNAATDTLSGQALPGTNGNYSINFVATNSAGSTSQAFTLTINSPVDSIGAFRPSNGSWSLASNGALNYNDTTTLSFSPLTDQVFFSFSPPGSTGVAGDWTGSGVTEIGDFRIVNGVGIWALDLNDNGILVSSDTFAFGQTGDQPVVGDWNGDGKTDIGVFRATPDGSGGGEFILDTNEDHILNAGDETFNFGLATDRIVIGDWNGAGKDEVGVFRDAGTSGFPNDAGDAVFSLDTNGDHTFDAGDQVFIFGLITDGLIVGDWNGQGKTDLGVYRDGSAFGAPGTALFSLDTVGNHQFSPADAVFLYGVTTDHFVSGHWAKTPPIQPEGTPQAQFAANGQGPGGGALLTQAQLEPVVDQAIAAWVADGASATLLDSVQVDIGSLDNNLVGETVGNQITLDSTADGWGWNTDSSNADFTSTGPDGLQATPGSAAAGQMDLLTVVEHELGHELGMSDVDPTLNPSSLMAATLPIGTRRTISSPAAVSKGVGPMI